MKKKTNKKTKKPQWSNTTLKRVIRKHCLDCSGFAPLEVRECPVYHCPLYDFRLGDSRIDL